MTYCRPSTAKFCHFFFFAHNIAKTSINPGTPIIPYEPRKTCRQNINFWLGRSQVTQSSEITFFRLEHEWILSNLDLREAGQSATHKSSRVGLDCPIGRLPTQLNWDTRVSRRERRPRRDVKVVVWKRRNEASFLLSYSDATTIAMVWFFAHIQEICLKKWTKIFSNNVERPTDI